MEVGWKTLGANGLIKFRSKGWKRRGSEKCGNGQIGIYEGN